MRKIIITHVSLMCACMRVKEREREKRRGKERENGKQRRCKNVFLIGVKVKGV